MLGRSSKDLLIASLKKKLPHHISVVLERTCNLQCKHCLYQKEKMTNNQNIQHPLLHLIKQMPKHTTLLHEGRILMKWHVELLTKIKKMRPDIKIGLIDNGKYTQLIQDFNGFTFDWLDISVDGLEKAHNKQRDSNSFNTAINGLKHSREVTKGRVSSLMTLTAINYTDIKPLTDFLFKNNLIDELHITPMSPFQPENHRIELQSFEPIWPDIKKVIQQYGVVFKVYRIQDLNKILNMFGKQKFLSAFKNKTKLAQGTLAIELDDVKIYYHPVSLWPTEGFLIDADGYYRVAYSQQFTLDQLHKNKGLKKYTIAKITKKTQYDTLYLKGVDHWWKYFGNYLEEEREFFRSLM